MLLFYILFFEEDTDREVCTNRTCQRFPLLVKDSKSERLVSVAGICFSSEEVKAGHLLACAASNKNTDSRESSSLFLTPNPLISSERLFLQACRRFCRHI